MMYILNISRITVVTCVLLEQEGQDRHLRKSPTTVDQDIDINFRASTLWAEVSNHITIC